MKYMYIVLVDLNIKWYLIWELNSELKVDIKWPSVETADIPIFQSVLHVLRINKSAADVSWRQVLLLFLNERSSKWGERRVDFKGFVYFRKFKRYELFHVLIHVDFVSLLSFSEYLNGS